MARGKSLRKLWKATDPSFKAASLLSLLAFLHVSYDYYRHDALQIGLLFRFAATSLLLFVLLAGIFRTMVREVKREVERQRPHLEDDVELHALRVFAVTKALARAILGVSLLLAWLGGMLMIFAGVVHHGYLLAVLLAGGYSVGCFFLGMRLVDFMDRVRFPAP